ncbi:MAG: flagellar basal body rod protein FlgB [bacterium]|nr:flagellar basal body rod protein FlgB [bacterium]
MNVTPSQFDAVQKLMSAAELRHRAIGENIANVNTPNYKRLVVDFESELAKHMAEGGTAEELNALKPDIHVDPHAVARGDGNTVDIDQELGDMSKNVMLYQTYAQLLTSKLSQMKAAISTR